jgi:ribosomal protein S27E
MKKLGENNKDRYSIQGNDKQNSVQHAEHAGAGVKCDECDIEMFLLDPPGMSLLFDFVRPQKAVQCPNCSKIDYMLL